MTDAEKSTRVTNLWLMIGASFFLGGRFMTERSAGSTPKD